MANGSVDQGSHQLKKFGDHCYAVSHLVKCCFPYRKHAGYLGLDPNLLEQTKLIHGVCPKLLGMLSGPRNNVGCGGISENQMQATYKCCACVVCSRQHFSFF